MSPQFTDDDIGKTVVNEHGEDVGIVADIEHGTAHVEPDPGITDTIKAKLGWGGTDDDTYPLQEEAVASVTRDEVRLESDMAGTGSSGAGTTRDTGGAGSTGVAGTDTGTGRDRGTDTRRDDDDLIGDDDDSMMRDDDDRDMIGGEDPGEPRGRDRGTEDDELIGDDDDDDLIGDDDDGMMSDDDDELIGDDDRRK